MCAWRHEYDSRFFPPFSHSMLSSKCPFSLWNSRSSLLWQILFTGCSILSEALMQLLLQALPLAAEAPAPASLPLWATLCSYFQLFLSPKLGLNILSHETWVDKHALEVGSSHNPQRDGRQKSEGLKGPREAMPWQNAFQQIGEQRKNNLSWPSLEEAAPLGTVLSSKSSRW